MRKNKVISLIVSVFLIFSVCLVPNFLSFADNWKDYRSIRTIPDNRISERIIDEADLLTDEEESILTKRVNDIYARYNYDVVIVTTYSLEGYTATEYADDFYDYNGFSKNGILFLLSTEYRDWAISTAGDGISAFTDSGQALLFNSMKDDLSNNSWYGALDIFTKQCNKYIGYYVENHTPYEPKESPHIVQAILIGLLFGSFFGFFVMSVRYQKNMKKMLGNEVGCSAAAYINGDIKIIDQYDYFIRNDHREHFVSDEHSSGASSTHTSSSGRTHGGSSGKF